ncbi:MAG: hypothetical protein QHH07_03400 [Sedimentisphaerales bacterium]|jgi:type II secretory pathway pseudopilin PulG|nr:hypothetical protein [Sedimentisphaerales bacterium]
MDRPFRDEGFTLVETIVGAVILAGVVVVVSAIGSNAMVASRLNRQYETAASIADRQLTMIRYAGVDQVVDAGGEISGRVDDVPPGYLWTVVASYEGIDALYRVVCTVTWTVQGRVYRLSIETQMNGASTIVAGATTGVGT